MADRLSMTNKATVLVQLARAMSHADTQRSMAWRLCLACTRVLGADSGAITLAYTRPERVTLCATDDTAARLEDLQDVLGEGPGADAFESGRAVRCSLGDHAAHRWSMFADSARQAVGPLEIHAFPMRQGRSVIGVLTLYHARGHRLRREPAEAQFLADAVVAALLHEPGTTKTPSPWSARASIDQATGMVVAQLAISPQDALVLLKAHAYADDTSLDLVAEAVVDRRFDFRHYDDSFGSDPS